MDKTNYNLLSIVGIVALTAIIAMFIQGSRFPSMEGSPRIEIVDTADDAVLTGNVVLTDRVQVPTPRPSPEFDWTRYDYNNNGVLDTADAELLAEVTNRVRFCPANKICDVDQNGVVELRDLGLFNAQLLKTAMENEVSRNRLTGQVTGGSQVSQSSAGGPGFWAAVTGAPVQ